VEQVCWRHGLMDRQWQRKLGTVDSLGTSLNSLYANTYVRLNLDAFDPLLNAEL